VGVFTERALSVLVFLSAIQSELDDQVVVLAAREILQQGYQVWIIAFARGA